MELTGDEQKIIENYHKLESKRCREYLVLYATSMVRAQEALKMDYGLMGLDTPLFNGTGAVPRSA
jgi:hypothetical protein